MPSFLQKISVCSLDKNSIKKHFCEELSVGDELVKENGFSRLLSFLASIENPTSKQQELRLQLLKLTFSKNSHAMLSLLINIKIRLEHRSDDLIDFPEECITLYINALAKPKEHRIDALLKKFSHFLTDYYEGISISKKETIFEFIKERVSDSTKKDFTYDRYTALEKSLPSIFESIVRESINYYKIYCE